MKTMLGSLTLVSQLKVELQKILTVFQNNPSPEDLFLNFIKLLKQIRRISLAQNKELLIEFLQFLDEKHLSEEENTMTKILSDFVFMDKDLGKIGREEKAVIYELSKDPKFFETLTLASNFTKQTLEAITQVEANSEIKLLRSSYSN